MLIDYHFSGASPFALLGQSHFREVAERHGAQVRFRPVDVGALWAVSGAVMPARRPPVRQRYRLVELQRLAEYRGLPLNPKPKHFPVDATLADGCAIAVQEAGGDPHAFIGANCRSVWVEEQDISDESVIRANLLVAGHDADAIVGAAGGTEVAALREANTGAAVAASAPGVPAYVVDGEVFWGQDRLEHLDHMLQTGRDPIIA